MEERWIRKQLRRSYAPTGWILIAYYWIMNVTVGLVCAVDAAIQTVKTGNIDNGVYDSLILSLSTNGWGYLISVAITFVILICWKKLRFWKEQVWAKGRPMTAGAFFAALAVLMTCQWVGSMILAVLESLLNLMGLSAVTAYENSIINSGTFSIFLYAGIAGPIMEELVFRGYIQRILRPYGKKFAIVCSAFLFAIFHGNLVQTPYAFFVGLVLGYVAMEYSIAWAMVLHMVNNLVLADMLSRMTAHLPAMTQQMILSGIIILFGIAGSVILALKHNAISAYCRQERTEKRCYQCFFGNAGVIVLILMMIGNMFLSIQPF